jgi:hypothetical protein
VLGTGYTVNNDAANGSSVVGGTAGTAASMQGPPNIVIIGPFAEHDYAANMNITESAWQADYQALVDSYLALTPPPIVYMMTPPPAAFVYQSMAEQTFAANAPDPAVVAVAQNERANGKKVQVIDLFGDAALATSSDMAGDGHFSAAGHAAVGALVYKALMCQ